MKIFITGGQGFIAGRLAQHLHLKSHSITIGTRNVNHNLLLNKEIKVIIINWSDLSTLKDALRGIDLIIHAAGPNSANSVNCHSETLHFSKDGTANLLNAAWNNQINKIIYLSTAHVYAAPLVGTINEDTILNNKHPYAISHTIVEDQIIGAKKRYNIDSLIFRISNSFGQPISKKTDCWNILINDICKQAVLTKKIIIKSKTSTVRNFIALSTVLNAIEFFIEKFDSKNNRSDIMNLGEKVSLSIEEVVNIIIERTNNIMGFSPEVIMQSSYNDKISNKNEKKLIKEYLDYQTIKLQIGGFNNYFPIKDEVDNLITYCNENF